jgi:hypothetical protein
MKIIKILIHLRDKNDEKNLLGKFGFRDCYNGLCWQRTDDRDDELFGDFSKQGSELPYSVLRDDVIDAKTNTPFELAMVVMGRP